MAYAVAFGVIRDSAAADDVTQEAYLQAFKRLGDLEIPGAFIPWLRRIVITMALNARRSRRVTLLRLDEIDDPPALDEQETVWSEQQRQQLASALLTLTSEERQLCDRRYHGRWPVERLAQAAGVSEVVMRKRLQRVRDKLRKEIEVSEQRAMHPNPASADWPAHIIELLARPKLTDLPDNPVGTVLDLLRACYASHRPIELPEVVDFEEARQTIGHEACYVEAREIHYVDKRRILRYDLTLPLLLNVRYEGVPLRLLSAGKTYRVCQTDAMHLEAFHQAEVFYMDERSRLDAWQVTGQLLQSINAVLPGRVVRISPTEYPMCSQAWELGVEIDGRILETVAWGVFTGRIVRHLGGDPEVHTAIGIGYGLERVAMMRYGIDDARKVEASRVA
jgi:RNA polymerase sigma factor (sigma-70 family)